MAGEKQIVLAGLVEYHADTDDDADPESIFSFDGNNSLAPFDPGQMTVAWDPTGTLTGLRCRSTSASECAVEIARDVDADFELDDETGVEIETLSQGSTVIGAPSLAFDSLGRVVAGYLKFDLDTRSVVVHDRDGDGLFTGPNERVEIEVVGGVPHLGEVAVDPSDRVAYVYFNAASNEIRVAYDRSADGDFDDLVGVTPELVTLAVTTGPPGCLGASFDASGNLAVVYDDGVNPPTLARDGNADGDFDEPGELIPLAAASGSACDVVGGGGVALAVAHNADDVRLLVDRDGNGDFLGVDENLILVSGGGSTQQLRLGLNASGRAFVATDTQVVVDPTP